MRLHLVSDLHLDHDLEVDERFMADLKPAPDVDLLVVAGDWYSVCRPRNTREMVSRLLELYVRVLLVPGNHDFWRATPEQAGKALYDAAGHYLGTRVFVAPEPAALTIAGQRFLCGTMWYRRPARRQIQDFIDFRQINAPRSWFFEQQQAFADLLYEGESIRDAVVVTHHLPTKHSTPPEFKASPTNHFFVCDMAGAIVERRPKLWLHGHTHQAFDYKVCETRVVCWPRGYPFEYRARPEPYEPKLIEVP